MLRFILIAIAIFLLFTFFLKKSRKNVNTPAKTSKQAACQILGVGENATADEINTAYKHLMQQYHPDKGGTEGIAMQINQARETLLDSLKN